MYRAIVGILLIILAVGAAAETSPLDKIKAANEQSLKSKSAASQFEYIDAAFKYLMEERQRVWQAVGDEMVSITDFNMTYALGEGTTVTYTLKNNSDIPIGRIAIDGESKTEGRSKPWFKFELTPAISGGLEPGEERKIESFKYRIPESKKGAVSSVRLKGVTDSNDKVIWFSENIGMQE